MIAGVYTELRSRIQDELIDLDRVVAKALRSWELVKKAPEEQDAYLDSVALNLHSFYSGLERLFELIARHVDGSLPQGETWHRDLLQQMSNDLQGVRPAVFCKHTSESLDDFRRFRHLVRNMYTTNFLPDKMDIFMSNLPGLWPFIKKELIAFSDFLAELEKSNQTNE